MLAVFRSLLLARVSQPLCWVVLIASGSGGCSSPDHAAGRAGDLTPKAAMPTLSCDVPNAGCACPEAGASVDCGKVSERFADYVTCSMGTRSCDHGVWGACIGERTTIKAAPVSSPGPEPQTLGSSAVCPADFDVCDPYCNSTIDTPGGFTTGAGFSNTPAGLTLVGTYTPTCTSLTLTPSTSTVTLTGSSISSLSASPVTFTLTAAPSNCIASPFTTTWTIDKFDRATIGGTDNVTGSLSVVVPIAGSIKVTAYAAGQTATSNIAVKVNVLEAPTTSAAALPNKPASATQIGLFGTLSAPLVGSGSSSATWLYPYSNTYFPLALPAPTAQYRYTLAAGDSTSAASAVKLSLRYPTGAAATAATFNYSLLVLEGNSVTCTATPARCNFLDPQLSIPQLAWQYFEQTARGQNADLIVQRLRSGANVLEPEQRLPIHFVDGQLKGTVFYNSYTSPQGGNTGAILAISPGATSPTLAVQPSGTCSTCHSINLDGSQLISNGGKNSSGTYTYDQSERYNTPGGAPSPTVLSTYTDNRFTYGGPWMDGSLYMSHGGGSDANWHAPTSASLLYSPTNSSASITLLNWPTNVNAVTPRFSPDGTKLAFGFWSGTSIPCATGAISPCTGSPLKLPSVSAGTRLAVMDFGCSTSTCTSASSGWTVSNARDVTPGVTERVAWPSFTPDGASVAYQRQYRSSKSLLSWAASDIGTIAGALSELWISNVPTNGSSAATPTRLSALNGLSSAGVSFLPQQARTLINDGSPLYTFQMARHELSQTVSSGSLGPDLVLTGAPAGGPWDTRIKIIAGGARGTATFQYSTNGASSWSATTTTAATVVLGSTGLTAVFPTGTYNVNSSYQALVGRVGIAGTPNGGPWDFRVKINTTGALGTATFKYSSDAGVTWSTALTTAATVSLGTTGLVASFASVTYSSTQWVFGAFVSHYHQDNAQFQLLEADSCSNNTTASGFYDYRANYLPSFAPTNVGSESFLVFTSRRMFGNVAYESGWDAEPGYSCSSGKTPTKKLWIAAVDSSWTPGTDPSHPAFYLPGQELAAGNSDGHWVNSACTTLNAACQSDDDCCGGTGAAPTTQCRVTSSATFPPTRQCQTRNSCATSGESCTTSANCCPGLTCPAGGGLCVQLPPKLFEVQTYSRQYVATCPSGTGPKWRFLEWQSTIPSGTQIAFSVQTKQTAAAAYAPATPLAYATATVTSAVNQWLRGATPIDTLLNTVSLRSQQYLLVTMVFSPNGGGTLAPTLNAWRQIYDCVPNE